MSLSYLRFHNEDALPAISNGAAGLFVAVVGWCAAISPRYTLIR